MSSADALRAWKGKSGLVWGRRGFSGQVPSSSGGSREKCTFSCLKILLSRQVLNFSPRAIIFLKLQFGLVFEIADFQRRKDLFEIDSPVMALQFSWGRTKYCVVYSG